MTPSFAARAHCFNAGIPLGREAMSGRFAMQCSRHFYRRIGGDTSIQHGAENAPKAADSAWETLNKSLAPVASAGLGDLKPQNSST
jgi:hypothetical protein